MRLINNMIFFSTVLTLSACFLVSDEEIKNRIYGALPSEMGINFGKIEKSLTCIAAEFTMPENFQSARFLDRNGNSTDSGLGNEWRSNASFFDYVEEMPLGVQRSTVEGTIVHGKPCMEGVLFSTNRLYDQPMIATRSKSGKELLIVFDNVTPLFGIYLAQGR